MLRRSCGVAGLGPLRPGPGPRHDGLGAVDHRLDPWRRHRRAGGGRPRRRRHRAQRRHQPHAHRGHRLRRPLPRDQPPLRALRGHRRAQRLRHDRPIRDHPRPQPGRRGGRHHEGGRGQRRRSRSRRTPRCSTRTTPRSGSASTPSASPSCRWATRRDVFSLALQAAGVSQTNSGQADFASGPDFAANGMRTRSNNFMIDGQDSNDPSVTGRQQPINNTDTVSEIRLITNQFSAEYGRAAGSVMNVVTKSGTNAFHGSGFWFANRNDFNALSNLDKAAGRTEAPFRKDDQYGGTLGGPIVKDNTFFFVGYQRWTQNAPRLRLHAERRAHRGRARRCCSRPRATCRRSSRCSSSCPPATGFVKNATLHARRPDLHGAARLDHGLGRPDLHQRPVHRAPRPAPRLEAQPERALPAQRDRVGRRRPGDAARASPPSTSPQQQSAAVWLTSTLSNSVVNELRVGVLAARHQHQLRRPQLRGDPLARDQRAGARRLQRRDQPHRDRPRGQPAAVADQRPVAGPGHLLLHPGRPHLQGRLRPAQDRRRELLQPHAARPARLPDAAALRRRHRGRRRRSTGRCRAGRRSSTTPGTTCTSSCRTSGGCGRASRSTSACATSCPATGSTAWWI